MKMYDIVIIGGGVVGSAIARELSRYKTSIALLEKEEELAFGVSKSNSGIIHPGTQNPASSLKGKLCVEGNLLIRKVSEELGLDFKQVGELIVALNKKEMGRLLELKKEAQFLGVPRLKIVDAAWLKKHEPNLNPKAVAALYAPTAGILSPYRLVYDLSENARHNGVEIHLKTLVKNIIFTPEPGRQSKPGFEIYTSRGAFKTKHLINAAGLFADEISKLVGINDFKIRARKGEEFLLDKKKEHLTNHLLFPLPTKTSKGILVIKTADGNPLIGPTAQNVEDKNDLSTTDVGLRKVLAAARKLVPAISGKNIIAYFAGLRPAAGDDFIVRNESKVPGFINVAGIQSPGLTAAPAIALMACRFLKRNGLSLKKKPVFHTYRKKTTHLFAIPLAQTKQLIKKDREFGDVVCRCELVSLKEVKEAITRGATTLDGIKFRTRAQAGRCHGSFCTTRLIKILSSCTNKPLTRITKRGVGSELVTRDRNDD